MAGATSRNDSGDCCESPSEITTGDMCSIHHCERRLYCLICRCSLCKICAVGDPDLEVKPVHEHHHGSLSIIYLSAAVKRLKSDLMNTMENMSTVLSSVDHYDDDIISKKLNLELSWLERKDRIRQEFVSLHDMLTEREAELLIKMEQDVETALKEMSDLEAHKHDLERKECQISDECLDLVQAKVSPYFETFCKDQQLLINKCESLVEEVKRLPNAADFWPIYLKMPFSMYREKVYLDKCLQFSSFDSYNISAYERVKYVPMSRQNDPITCKDLVNMADALPPSTSCCFDVAVHSSWLHDAYVYSSVLLDFSIFNDSGRLYLFGDSVYLVEIQPIFTSVGNRGVTTTSKGKTVYVMVTTGAARGVEQTPSNGHWENDTQYASSSKSDSPFQQEGFTSMRNSVTE